MIITSKHGTIISFSIRIVFEENFKKNVPKGARSTAGA